MKRFAPELMAAAVLVLPLVAGLTFAGGNSSETGRNPETKYQVPKVHTEDGISFVEQGGIRGSLTIQPLSGHSSEKPNSSLQAGQRATVMLQFLDTGSETSLRGLHPAGWLRRRKPGDLAPDSARCLEMIREFASGGLSTGAEIDLNQFYLYALNSDRSITIINPLISFSRTKLIGIITLPAPGVDWVLDRSSGDLLVTLPSAGSVALIDTRRRLLRAVIEVGGRPERILAAGDTGTAWIADATSGAVTVMDTKTAEIIERFEIGSGSVRLVATTDGSRIFAASSSGHLAVLDGQRPRVLQTAQLADIPTALGLSELARAVFIAAEGTGVVSAYDIDSGARRLDIQLEPGLSDVAVTPDGRWGLVANWMTDTVDVFDTATGSRSRTFDVEPGPDRITFSDSFAYVHSTDSANLTLIQWQALGKPGSLPVVMVPIGQNAPGEARAGAVAASVQQVPGGGAVVAANPVDRMLYYYGEGMMAPMGSYQNYSREPMAVMVVDNSLRETTPGVYATDIGFTEGGVYDLPFFVESPRLAGCFEVTVAALPGDRGRYSGPLVRAEFQPPPAPVAGQSTSLTFRLNDPRSGKPLSGLRDVSVMTFRPPGLFQARLSARELDPGRYEATVVYPDGGEYIVLPACESRGARYGELPVFRVTVSEAASAATTADNQSTQDNEKERQP